MEEWRERGQALKIPSGGVCLGMGSGEGRKEEGGGERDEGRDMKVCLKVLNTFPF